MEKPGKKLKKLLTITGTTGAVYAGFQYLLPLVAPFFAGYIAALCLRPWARYLSYRLKITVGDRTCRLPVGICGGVIFLIMLSAASILLYYGGLRLWQQGEMFVSRLPFLIKEFDRWLTGRCDWLEGLLGLKKNTVSYMAAAMVSGLADWGRTAAMPMLMTNSVSALAVAVKGAIVAMVTFLATVLSLQEMEELRERRDNSLFAREIRLIGDRLVQTGKAWLKSQGLIWILITAVCIAGMFLMKNPYYLMAGLGIGILDALPIFGTGTILIPWILLELLGKNWKTAAFLLALYLVCYILRQLMETHVMGGNIGLSPLETLAAVYVGLELFGFFGVILGPLGLLLVKDLVNDIDKAGNLA